MSLRPRDEKGRRASLLSVKKKWRRYVGNGGEKKVKVELDSKLLAPLAMDRKNNKSRHRYSRVAPAECWRHTRWNKTTPLRRH